MEQFAILISRIAPVIAGAFCLFVGFKVYLSSRSKPANRLFLVFSLILSVWAYACFVQSTTTSPEIALYHDYLLYSAAVFAPAVFLQLVLELIGVSLMSSIAVPYLISAALLILNFTPVFRNGIVQLFHNRYVTDPGIGWYFYVVFFTMMVAFAYYKMIISARNVGLNRAQSIYIYLANSVLVIGGASYFILILQVLEYPLDAWANLLSSMALALYIAITAYAITRHRLMDIEVIIRKGLVFSVLSAMTTAVFFLVIYLCDIVLRDVTGYNLLYGSIPAVILLTLLIYPLKQRIQNRIDALFNADRAQFRQAISMISADTARAIDMSKISQLISERLPIDLELRYALLQPVSARSELVSENSHNEIVFPVKSEDMITANLILGTKDDSGPHTEEEMALLGAYAVQLGVSIEDASLHEQILRDQNELLLAHKL